jgi:hypothetical protein
VQIEDDPSITQKTPSDGVDGVLLRSGQLDKTFYAFGGTTSTSGRLFRFE